MDLLAERYIYRPLTTDSTNKHKNNLINILRAIKAEGGLGDLTYKRLHPNGTGLENFIDNPWPTKRTPPYVHSFKQGCSHTWGGWGVGHHHQAFGRTFPHRIRNTQDSVDQIKSIILGEEKCITSYDVKDLFTSVPVDHAIPIIRLKLGQDMQLYLRTHISIQHIITLLEFFLENIYFLFQGKY